VSKGYIPSIDGLRAFAVLFVIIFHGFPNLLPGGYIGVDVFFVISGFLITQIIISQALLSKFSFLDFYSRRIRRIFPALLLVFLAVYGLGWFLMLADEFAQLGKHIAAGAAFISNWVYWLESGYFDELLELKPLLNLWSLGVEEQFYILWPCFLIFCIKTKIKMRAALLGVILISLVINILFVGSHQTATFFLPFARIWELGLGGLIATERKYFEKLHLNLTFLLIIGLLGICAPLFYLTPQSIFPGWAVLPPVLGTAILLVLIDRNTSATRFLSTKWIVGLGRISYPLYLWHWPLLSFGRLIKGKELDGAEVMGLLGLSLLLSYLTYSLIESKLRHQGKRVTIILILLMTGIGVQGWSTYQRGGLEFRLSKNIQISPEQKRDFIKWEKKEMLPTGDCQPGFIYPEAHVCAQTNWNKNPDIVVIGDSHAFSAYWGIAQAYGAQHVIKLIGQGACAPFIGAGAFGQYPDCEANIDAQLNWISENPAIKTVFITHRSINLRSDGETAKFESAVQKTFELLLSKNKNIIYTYSVPELGFEPRLCVGELPFGRRNPVESCSYPMEKELGRQASYRSAIAKVLQKYPTVRVYDPYSFLCPQGICTAVIDGRSMYTDTNHLSESGSLRLGSNLEKKFPSIPN